MCDGVTQGQRGMELSLFSRGHHSPVGGGGPEPRHVRRRGAARYLRQDRAGPPHRGSALRPPADDPDPRRADALGPRQQGKSSGSASSTPRARWGATNSSNPSPPPITGGTCTFYGTANSNQMMMDMMGLHMPGASFINPGTKLRQAVTRAAIHRLTEIGADGNDYGRSGVASMRRPSSTRRRAARHRRFDQPRGSTCRPSPARRAS